MKSKELFNLIKERLRPFSKEAETEARIITEKLTGTGKLEILLNKEISLTEEIKNELEKVLQQREKRVPLQYIFKEQNFRSYTFYVDNRVLIPRPETEILVEEIISTASQKFPDRPLKIADIGCGSGAIALSLAIEIPEAVVYTVDISKEALAVAEINRDRYKVPGERLILLHGDKLEIFRESGLKFDIIVSNPPYIPQTDYLELEAEVKNYEPATALVGTGEDGTGFYEYFAAQAGGFLNKDGNIFFELGIGQAETVKGILECKGFDNIKLIQDYNGIDRIITARVKL